MPGTRPGDARKRPPFCIVPFCVVPFGILDEFRALSRMAVLPPSLRCAGVSLS
jgi:hypothetical protein